MCVHAGQLSIICVHSWPCVYYMCVLYVCTLASLCECMWVWVSGYVYAWMYLVAYTYIHTYVYVSTYAYMWNIVLCMEEMWPMATITAWYRQKMKCYWFLVRLHWWCSWAGLSEDQSYSSYIMILLIYVYVNIIVLFITEIHITLQARNVDIRWELHLRNLEKDFCIAGIHLNKAVMKPKESC